MVSEGVVPLWVGHDEKFRFPLAEAKVTAYEPGGAGPKLWVSNRSWIESRERWS